eukprot:8285265-Pyramimonas_sp.AAC.1
MSSGIVWHCLKCSIIFSNIFGASYSTTLNKGIPTPESSVLPNCQRGSSITSCAGAPSAR